MKSYAIGLYEKAMPNTMEMAEKLQYAKDCGYDFLEMSIDETEQRMARLDWSQAERLALTVTMKEIGLPVRSICLSAHRRYPLGASDPADRAKGCAIMRKAIDLADDLGIRIIQLAGYDVYYEAGTEQTRADFEANLRRAVDYAARKGVILAFETMENEFMNTVERCMRYVRQVNSPYLGLYPDTGNITNAAKLYGSDVLEDMELGRGHMFALHLKESLPGRFREVPYLSGHVDFKALIEKAWSLGVRRYLTEMWDVGKDTWKEDILTARSIMCEILDSMEGANESL